MKTSFLYSFSPRVQKAYTLIRNLAQSADDLHHFNRCTLDIWIHPAKNVQNFKGKIIPDQLLLLKLEQYYLRIQPTLKHITIEQIQEAHNFLYESLRKRRLL